MTAKRWDIKHTFRWFLPAALAVLAVLIAALSDVWNKDTDTRCSNYQLLEGTELETTVCVVKGKLEGPVIYIVAGIHGDETAGWMAAKRLEDSRPEAGTLYVISRANGYGVEQNRRRTKEDRDLNRNFPGDRQGCDAERIAAAIYGDIRDKKPDVVLDLHEAQPEQDGRDALGNSVICQSLQETGDMILELLADSERGLIGSSPLTLYGSPPPGSINRVVTEKLGIPAITVETFREEELEQRIENQLAIVDFVMEFYGLKSN